MEDNSQELKAQQLLVEAEIKARSILAEARQNASNMINVQSERTNKLYIDMSRVPLICQAIISINNALDDLKELIAKKNDDHETRIRNLENTVGRGLGIIGVVMPVALIIIQVLIQMHFSSK